RPNYFLRVDDILPEAFVGRPGAPVVLLGNNPGFKDEAGIPYKREAVFVARLRKNLLHQSSDYPFVFLAPDISERLKTWWERKLRDLIARFGRQTIANAILAIEHFPYPSRRYGHRSLHVPSQAYNFRLVCNAIDRGAVIVLMQGEKRWFNAVPHLNGYHPLVRLKNFQQPTINPGNCRDGGYHEIVRAIEAMLLSTAPTP
ncbi:MAG TPA: hypothetical protein VG013_30585, partial [Gemmataceae bacterium]|nr:hypothetical protein [Gemmataceae bacterium]